MPLICPIGSCSRTFARKDYIYSHIRNQHRGEWSEAEITRYQEDQKKKETMERQAGNPVPCPHCYQRFPSNKRLNEHIGREHPNLVEKKAEPTVKCPLCEALLWTREGLADHCAEHHKKESIDFEVEEEKFGSIEEFEEYSEGDGSLAVRFCRDHIGHECEPSKIPLNAQDRATLNGIFDQRYEVPRIREILRSFGRKSPLYYFSTRMIKELKHRHEDRPWRKDDDQPYSVRKRYLEGETEGLRRVDVDQTNPDATRIVTISETQTPCQAADCHRCRGLPAAHLLSYHMTEHDVAFLIEEIVKVHPTFEPAYFMSDAAPSLFNGFKKALPDSSAVRLYCIWHFLKFIRERVNVSYIGDERQRGEEVYSTIKQLTLTIPRKEFTHLLTTLMDSLTDEEGNEFKDYFRSYARDRSLWAPYERSNAPFNTSMFNEAYHRAFKTTWLPKGRRARLDELVHTLLTVPEIHNEDLAIEDEKGLLIGKYRLSEQYQRHRICQKEYEGNPAKITSPSVNGRWSHRMEGGTTPSETRGSRSATVTSRVYIAGDDAPEEAPRFLDVVNDDIFHDHAFQPRVIIQGEENEGNDERALDEMIQPEDEEARKEEEKKREEMAEMRSDFYRYLEDAKTRFEFASKKKFFFKTDNQETLKDFLENFKSAIDDLPVPHGRRGRAPAPKKIRDHLRFDPPSVRKPGRKRGCYGAIAPALVPAEPDQMQTCYKCQSDKPPSTNPIVDENEKISWVKCPECSLWSHQVCVPIGAICESCYSARLEPESEV